LIAAKIFYIGVRKVEKQQKIYIVNVSYQWLGNFKKKCVTYNTKFWGREKKIAKNVLK
jgi:hypothetical protein